MGCKDRPLGVFPVFDAGSKHSLNDDYRNQELVRPPDHALDTSSTHVSWKLTSSHIFLYVHHCNEKQDDVKDAFKDLMANHRNLKFVSIDSTKLETSLEKKLGIKPFDGSHQLVHFTRYNVTGKVKVCCRCAGRDRVFSRALTGLRYSACMVVYVHRPANHRLEQGCGTQLAGSNTSMAPPTNRSVHTP